MIKPGTTVAEEVVTGLAYLEVALALGVVRDNMRSPGHRVSPQVSLTPGAVSMHLSLMETIIYPLHTTIAREFLQELSSKSLWLYMDNFVDGTYTVGYQEL